MFREWRWVVNRNPGQRPVVFNYDLHISVTRDLGREIANKADFLSWSASLSNRLIRPDQPKPDPVFFVNQWTWTRLSTVPIMMFRLAYRSFLAAFDGFVVTYPTPFVLLFEQSNKPILAMAAIRYDWPMSRSPRLAQKLDLALKRMVESGQLTLVANNQGDADYILAMTGLSPAVVPSLCDYVLEESGLPRTNPESFQKRQPAFMPSGRLENEFKAALSGQGMKSIEELYPNGYEWADLLNTPYVFFVPYTISTMTLFELATLGVTVVIPDDDWLIEMYLAGENGALSELDFPGAIWRDPIHQSIPNPSRTEEHLRWWLARADFSNKKLMPNVVRVCKSDDLSLLENLAPTDRETIEARNSMIEKKRARLIDEFMATMKEQK